MTRPYLLAALLPLGAVPAAAQAPAAPADRWFEALRTMCDRTVEGRIEAARPAGADADFAGKRLVARGGPCTADEIRIAFDVGEDRSRTWIVRRSGERLTFKHDHRLADGSEDPVSRYGGDAAPGGTAVRQSFPVDAETRAVFTANDLERSLPNIWSIEIEPDRRFVYELARPGRLFRVRFDLAE